MLLQRAKGEVNKLSSATTSGEFANSVQKTHMRMRRKISNELRTGNSLIERRRLTDIATD